MNMKINLIQKPLRWTLCILCLLALLLGCASAGKTRSTADKIRLFEQEVNNWREFRITGISELETQALSFRNHCVILKSEERFRFDILNAGLLGLGSGVFMQFYADGKQIQYREPLKPNIQTKDLNIEALKWVRFLSGELYDELLANKREIVETQFAHFEGFDIHFHDNMRLRQIVNQNYEVRINFYYDRQENLYEIRVTVPVVRNLTIHIDKIEHHDVVVNPLK